MELAKASTALALATARAEMSPAADQAPILADLPSNIDDDIFAPLQPSAAPNMSQVPPDVSRGGVRPTMAPPPPARPTQQRRPTPDVTSPSAQRQAPPVPPRAGQR